MYMPLHSLPGIAVSDHGPLLCLTVKGKIKHLRWFKGETPNSLKQYTRLPSSIS